MIHYGVRHFAFSIDFELVNLTWEMKVSKMNIAYAINADLVTAIAAKKDSL